MRAAFPALGDPRVHAFDLVRVDERRGETVFDAESAAGTAGAFRRLACAAHYSPVAPRVTVVLQSRDEALFALSPLCDLTRWDATGPGPAAARRALRALLARNEAQLARVPHPGAAGGGGSGRGGGGAPSSSSSSDGGGGDCGDDGGFLDLRRATEASSAFGQLSALAESGDFALLAAKLSLMGEDTAPGAAAAASASAPAPAAAAGAAGQSGERVDTGAWVLSEASRALPARLYRLANHARAHPATWRSEPHWEACRLAYAAGEASARPAGFDLCSQPHWGDGMLKNEQGLSVGFDGSVVDPRTGLPYGKTFEDLVDAGDNDGGGKRAQFDKWWEESSEDGWGTTSSEEESSDDDEDEDGESSS